MEKVTTLVIGDLAIGDCVEFRTAHSHYRFWVEFPDQAVGILFGGRLPGPTRVRLSADPATATDAPTRPIHPGEHARLVLLAPDGTAIRCIVTSTIVEIMVVKNGRAAA
ncbi:MAG: hypothetical protein IPF53_07360 [Blastocatellia bacterium]|jgi:hypothetical protein|nr:hypothetical protein [Blastocatellia bacterium]MBK6427930.1 hypothetical protein [Blastocatellia bacterium]